MALDSGARRYSCQEFRDIIALGVPALPEILEKMSDKNDPYAIELEAAIISITRAYLPAEESRRIKSNADKIDAWMRWLRDSNQNIAANLSEHLEKMKQAKREGRSEDAFEAVKRITRLGTLALPHLFAGIAKGETDLIPVASELVMGAFPPTATPDQCGEWWKQNKIKWTVPISGNDSDAKQAR